MFRSFLVLDVERDFERFLGSTGLLDEGTLLGLTSISSSDSASLLLLSVHVEFAAGSNHSRCAYVTTT